MEQLRHYRWGILGAAIGMLLLPTYVVLAAPQMQTITFPDLSWLTQLSEALAVLVVLAVILLLVLRYLNDNKRVTDPKDPTKTVSTSELLAFTVTNFSQILIEHNQQSQLVVQTLQGMKDELIQGRGNQMTAIIDVHDTVNDKLNGMAGALATRNEQMERVSGGLTNLQDGQTKMQQDLGALLDETRNLSKAIINILTRLENVDSTVQTVDTTVQSVNTVIQKVDQALDHVNDSTITIKDEILELKRLFHSVDERLNKITVVAGSAVQGPADPLSQPDNPPALTEKNRPDEGV